MTAVGVAPVLVTVAFVKPGIEAASEELNSESGSESELEMGPQSCLVAIVAVELGAAVEQGLGVLLEQGMKV